MEKADFGISSDTPQAQANLKQRIAIGLGVIALSIFVAPVTSAQCVAHARSSNASGPQVSGLKEPAALDNDGASDQSGSSVSQNQEQNGSLTILGFWKTVYFAGGVLNDIGFRQYNAGGTELLNDSPIPDGGNNFCMGAWKRVGVRTCERVHPFLVFDDSGKKPIAIGIEQSRIIVAQDANTFRGRWAQDNYDFSGNLIPGNHFDGTMTGTRIFPGLPLLLPFPFPFPL